MSDIVIQVEKLGKLYRIRRAQTRHDTLRDALAAGVRAPLEWLRRNGRPGPQGAPDHIWALKDVSFEVKQGEVLGIIGRNGAGKSTLLKILSRITEPTEGRALLRGRVGSLLEVGTGFHPELTGRENIYLSGAILGMRRAEIERKFDEIVAFAEIEQFLDTPVKRYSSGMYVRLAFAVAAHLEPEILLVDEVLAVGDAAFQKKCLGKMGDVAREGRTVLFVSHNMQAVQNLCDRAVLLRNGVVACLGHTSQVVAEYMSSSLESRLYVQWSLDNAPGNAYARLLKAAVRTPNGADGASVFTMADDIELEFEFYNLMQGQHNLDVTMHLQDERGILVLVSGSGGCPPRSFSQGSLRATCRIPGHLLNEGVYTINRLLLVKDRGYVVYEHPDVLTFQVVAGNEGRWGWMAHKEGVVRPVLEWRLEG